MNVSPCL